MVGKNLLFFTVTYPFGKDEAFIESEIGYLAQMFSKIIILPKNYYGSKKIRIIPSNVSVEKPLLFSNIILRSLRGIFNRAPILYFFTEFFVNKVYAHPMKLFWWFVHSVDTRTLLSSPRFFRILDENPGALMYFYWGRGTCYVLPFLKKYPNKRVVRFHRIDLYDIENHLSFRKQLIESLDFAVTISEDGRQYLSKRFPSFSDKFIVSRLGTKDNGLSKYSEDGVFRILTCSYIIKRKRVDFLAKALTLITEHRIEWVHIGDGPERENVLSVCKHLPNNISFVSKGSMKNEEVLEYYKSNPVDLFINISTSEGIPVSIMEAFSFGIPVIATNVGANKEIVDKEVGLLIPLDSDPHNLKKAIFHVIASNHVLLRNNARLRWEGFYNADKNYSEYIRFLESIINTTTKDIPIEMQVN